MSLLFKQSQTRSLLVPAGFFAACILLFFSSKYKLHTAELSLPLLIDLVIVAPLAYFIIDRKNKNAKFIAPRIFMTGLFIATFIFADNPLPEFVFIKKWIGPVVEAGLISFVIYNLVVRNKNSQRTASVENDFLVNCRELMLTVFHNEKIAGVVASEFSVFYYLFHKRSGALNNQIIFTTYKENGSRLVLTTFLCLFIIETIAMHFLFQLWNTTAAWIIAGISAYSCFQLWAHIRALYTRPSIISNGKIFFRNGLLGGETIISFDNIAQIEMVKKQIKNSSSTQIAFIKGLEKPNLLICLREPVIIIKAFGIKKKSTEILINIDQPKRFLQVLAPFL